MSNITGEVGSLSSGDTGEQVQLIQPQRNDQFHSVAANNGNQQQQPPAKRKRNLPGTPDPTAEVIALSPTTLMATNRFVCEICNKGFQRDQNLPLHRRGHNLPWKLRQTTSTEVRKRVYICPEPSSVHNNPARALGDLTGIKKHFSRKHGEKKWKCDKCPKNKLCYRTGRLIKKLVALESINVIVELFSPGESFITHRAFCDALAEENSKVNQGHFNSMGSTTTQSQMPHGLISPNSSMGMSEFSSFSYEHKTYVESFPQDHGLCRLSP